MNAQKFFTPIAIVTILGLNSCDKKETALFTGGKPGQSKLKVLPKHHNNPIDNGKVYIKYDALELPKSYDDSARIFMENGVPVAIFDHLRMGNYYIYGQGFDNNIGETVKGGGPVAITRDSSIITYNLAVSEDHGGGSGN